MVILILIAFIVACLTVDAAIRYSRKKKFNSPAIASVSSNVFNETNLMVPKGIYFDKSHTWAFMEKSGVVKIGIDDFLLHATGPLNRVKMKNPGEKIFKGEPLLSIIQNGKQLTLCSPITGTVKSQNIQLSKDCIAINSSPFHEGWVYTAEPNNWMRETQFLLMAEPYKDWLKTEFSRLKDFLAGIRQTSELVPIMLQDGGEINDNVLEDFGPEVWEEFQIKFINTSK